jgi:hypothetical protein
MWSGPHFLLVGLFLLFSALAHGYSSSWALVVHMTGGNLLVTALGSFWFSASPRPSSTTFPGMAMIRCAEHDAGFCPKRGDGQEA